jgi:hypothetical protein
MKMKMPKIPPADPETPRGTWEKVIVSTPVVLTVVATILAGLSSSEMNQGQYHRALAAQNQSKAGDQWSLFQAKRGRQSGMENTVSVLEGMAGAGDADLVAWQDSVRRLSEEMKSAQDAAGRMKQAAAGGKGGVAAGADLAIERFGTGAPAKLKAADAINAELMAALEDKNVVAGLTAMLSGRLPEVEKKDVGSEKVRELLKAIENRQPESETVAMVSHVSGTELEEAFATARANEKAFDEALGPINAAAERVGAILVRRMTLGRAFERSTRELAAAGTEAAGEGATMVPEIRLAAAELSALITRERALQSEIYNSFTLARLRFGAKRYEHEAKYNLLPSQLYEIQVRQSSATSERHRVRSKRFFYGMLCAQAGVTIATLAMAVRRRSVMWGLASVAGLSAIVFAGYVYLFI